MREKGELSDKDFERLNCWRLIAGESSKDGLVVYRRRGYILTNYAFIKARVDKIRLAAEAKAAKAAAALVTKNLVKTRKMMFCLVAYLARKSTDRPKAPHLAAGLIRH